MNDDIRNSLRKSFVTTVILTVIVTIGAFVYKGHQVTVELQSITRMQYQDDRALEKILSKISEKKNYNMSDLALSAIETRNARAEHIMELAITDLKSDVDILSLWAGIITIVFLVFSIYSIFRTDEMLAKANETLESIKEKERTAESIVKQLTESQETQIRNLSQRINAVTVRADDVEQRLLRASASV